jgi:hypothetical protein
MTSPTARTRRASPTDLCAATATKMIAQCTQSPPLSSKTPGRVPTDGRLCLCLSSPPRKGSPKAIGMSPVRFRSLHWPDIGEEREIAPQIAARCPLIGSSSVYSPAKVGPRIQPVWLRNVASVSGVRVDRYSSSAFHPIGYCVSARSRPPRAAAALSTRTVASVISARSRHPPAPLG